MKEEIVVGLLPPLPTFDEWDVFIYSEMIEDKSASKHGILELNYFHKGHHAVIEFKNLVANGEMMSAKRLNESWYGYTDMSDINNIEYLARCAEMPNVVESLERLREVIDSKKAINTNEANEIYVAVMSTIMSKNINYVQGAHEYNHPCQVGLKVMEAAGKV